MRKTVCICDRCGNDFDPADGYEQVRFNEIGIYTLSFDLCSGCMESLQHHVRLFMGLEGGND